VRDEDRAAPVCRFCGKGPDEELGCIVRLHWDFDEGEYLWQHRVCSVRERWKGHAA
jgi:hypothetical protein